jgi:predicted dehydrogenase
VRVALFGCGWIQDFHARGVVAHGDELVAVANHREASAREFADRYSIPRVETDWHALADDPDIDAAIVATPNALHAPQSVALLRAGTHVMVEKPMAIGVAECDTMIAASEQGGAFLMVAHCWRFRDEVIAMRERIAKGEFGDVIRTHGYGVHAGWGPSGWFTDLDLAGGGALVDMGVHAIDTARFLLGDPAPGRVCASIRTRYADGRYTVDDDGLTLISWSNGTDSLVESGWWQPHLGGLEADTEVYGTKGYGRIWDPVPPSDDYEHCTQPMYSAQVVEAAYADSSHAEPPL